MKKNTLKTLIKVFIGLAVIAFIYSFWNPWSMLACLAFGSIAMVISMFYNVM